MNEFDVYLKKLTTQELGYRKGRLMTGGYFYISKSVIGVFFKELNKYVLNDYLRLTFNDPLEQGNVIQASYVYHNDKHAKKNGTRNEYRIYHNRDLAKHELHFQPFEIIAFIKLDVDKYKIDHFTPRHISYKTLDGAINNSKLRGCHALLTIEQYNDLLSVS
jgi:hypothetical protein